MGRTNQGGSVLGFVIVGVALAALLVGGIYLVNRQTAQQPAPGIQTPQEEKPQDKPANGEGTPPAKPDTTQPDTSPNQPEAAPQPTPTPDSATQLPATGPKEAVGSFVILGLLAGVAVSYVQSRRSESRP